MRITAGANTWRKAEGESQNGDGSIALCRNPSSPSFGWVKTNMDWYKYMGGWIKNEGAKKGLPKP